MLGGAFSSPADLRDVESLNALPEDAGEEIPPGLAHMSRDNGRTPMQWDGSANAGFTDASPWIGVPRSASQINVAAQLADDSSVLAYYRALIDARHRIGAATDGGFTRLDMGDPALFFYLREHEGSSILVATNLSSRALTPSPRGDHEDTCARPWRLYLANTRGCGVASEGAPAPVDPASPMGPWEARVYLIP